MSPFDPWLATYAPGTVAERPWWRVTWDGWRRIDGAVPEPLPPEAYTVPIDDGGMHAPRETWVAHLDAYDDAHPRPVPPPMCGQVWAFVNAPESALGIEPAYRTVVYTSPMGATFAGTRMSEPDFIPRSKWPRPNAVLVAGPHAPWAPKGWRP